MTKNEEKEMSKPISITLSMLHISILSAALLFVIDKTEDGALKDSCKEALKSLKEQVVINIKRSK